MHMETRLFATATQMEEDDDEDDFDLFNDIKTILIDDNSQEQDQRI